MTSTDTSAFFGAGKRSSDYDQYDRYLLPDETGSTAPWTRATTFASTLAEQYGLTQWHQRMVVWGLSRRPDLLALANTISGPEDKKALGEIVKSAHEAAGTKAKANLGDAVHKACEDHDNGLAVPSMHQADVDAYARCLAEQGYEPMRGWIERVVIVPQYRVAGKFDRLLRCPDGKVRVGDIKTGNLDYADLEFAIQLALYANASAAFNYGNREYEPLPRIETDYAVIMHIPAGSAKAALYRVNIDLGWALARLCAEARDARKLKNLITPMPHPTPTIKAGDYATGGIITPTDQPYLVGERGCDLSVPRQGATEFEDFWSTAPETDDGDPVSPDEPPAPTPAGPPPPASLPTISGEHGPELMVVGQTGVDGEVVTLTLPAGSEAARIAAGPDFPMSLPAEGPQQPSAVVDVQAAAEAIVKGAKGKAKVQQLARELCASLSLPESTIKLNQQQVKIATAIVELAVSQGVPIPGVQVGTSELAEKVKAGPSPDDIAAMKSSIANGAVLARIKVASSVADLTALRESVGAGWTPEHTEAARVKADQILSGPDGERPLTPLEMINGATSKQTLSLAWKVATSDGDSPDGWTAELQEAARTKLAQLG